jgi:hypothetical protein
MDQKQTHTQSVYIKAEETNYNKNALQINTQVSCITSSDKAAYHPHNYPGITRNKDDLFSPHSFQLMPAKTPIEPIDWEIFDKKIAPIVRGQVLSSEETPKPSPSSFNFFQSYLDKTPTVDAKIPNLEIIYDSLFQSHK